MGDKHIAYFTKLMIGDVDIMNRTRNEDELLKFFKLAKGRLDQVNELNINRLKKEFVKKDNDN